MKRCYSLISGLFLAIASLSVTASPYNLEITTHLGDNQTFHHNDKIQFLVSLDKPAYLLLFYKDAENNLLRLYPSANSTKKPYPPGIYLPIPDARKPFELFVSAPFGKENIYAFAMEQPAPLLKGKQINSEITILNYSIEYIRRYLHNFAEKNKLEIDEAELSLNTLK